MPTTWFSCCEDCAPRRRTLHGHVHRDHNPLWNRLNCLAHTTGHMADLVSEEDLFQAFGRATEERRTHLIGAEDSEMLEEGLSRGYFVSNSEQVNERQNLVGKEAQGRSGIPLVYRSHYILEGSGENRRSDDHVAVHT